MIEAERAHAEKGGELGRGQRVSAVGSLRSGTSGRASYGGLRIPDAGLSTHRECCVNVMVVSSHEDALCEGQIIIMNSTHGANAFATSNATNSDGSAYHNASALSHVKVNRCTETITITAEIAPHYLRHEPIHEKAPPDVLTRGTFGRPQLAIAEAMRKLEQVAH